MESNKTQYTKDLHNKQLLVTRNFDAPLEMVWRAWTESDLLDQWWAPRPYRAETKSLNFTEGGNWVYCMAGPNGERQWCKVDFKKIAAYKSFEVATYFCDENGVKNEEMPTMEWRSVFTPTGTATKVEVTVSFTSQEALEKIIELGFREGFAAAHDNLDEVLAKA